jgi:hypothetical protein
MRRTLLPDARDSLRPNDTSLAKATPFASREKTRRAQRIPRWQKPRLLPAAKRLAAPNSAEIASGDFSL